MPRVMDGLRQRLAHQPRSRNRAIQARVVHHLDNRLYASSLFAHHMRPCLRELDFTGSIGTVPHLVLKPLDMESVALAGRCPARKQEAAKTLRRLRQDKKRVAHRRGTKPFVAGDQVLTRASDSLSPRRVGPNVRAALFFRHAHAQQRAGFRLRRRKARIVNR